MKTQELYDILQRQMALHGRKLDVTIQVNEDEVYVLNQLKIVFKTDEGKKSPHCLILVPELFREPTGKPPCAHISRFTMVPDDIVVNETLSADQPITCAVGDKYDTLFCPDCGAKINSREESKQ